MNFKRNKYKVAPREDRTWKGRVYASLAEMKYAMELALRVQFGLIVHVKEQPVFHLGCVENKYKADFLCVCTLERGGNYVVDVKGFETQKFKHDKKLWRSYGPCPLHIVKRKGNRFITTEIIEGPTP